MSKELESWLTWFWAIGLIAQGGFWIIFAQFTMRRIERHQNGTIWDLLNQEKGVRILSYAFLILFPANITNRLVSYRKVEIIQKYATNADWWRALLFYSTHFTWLFITVIGVASGAFDTGAETYR